VDLRRTLVPAAALAALSAAVAAGFDRVFSGGRWIAPVIVAALIPHAIGVLTRGRRVAVTVTAWAAGLAAYAIWVLAPSTTSAGVPTGSTLRELSDRLDAGLNALRDQAAPVPARSGVVLLAVLAVWIMAAFADHLAFRRSATVGAVAPGITLFIWIAALAPDAESHLSAAAAVVVTGALFVALQHQVLLTRRRNTVAADRSLPAPRLVTGGLALGVAGAMVALAVTPMLPGAGADPLIDLRDDDLGSSTYQTAIPPLVDVTESLRRGQQLEVFTVRASAPQYWRTVALDNFTDDGGGQWTLQAEGGDISRGLSGAVPLGAVEQQYRIGTLGERWMPAAYEPVAVNRSDTLVVEESRTLVTAEDTVAGLSYRVASAPPPTSLTEAQRRGTDAPLPESVEQFTELPNSLPEEIGDLARSVTAGATNPYDRARLLRDYFRGGLFTYDTSVDLDDQVGATLVFLRERRGFCVQFASTYALMARSLGIPTRVAVGFTPGGLNPDTGRYRVTNYEAHAWPEVWLSGVGWTNQFDPTPPSTQPGGSDLPGDTAAAAAPAEPTTPSTTAGTAPPPTAAPAGPPVAPPPAGTTDDDGAGPWTTIVALVVVAILLVGAALATVPALKRRRRRARQRRVAPAHRVAGAGEEAVDRVREIGQSPPITETPTELAATATSSVGAPAATSLQGLADAHTAAQFGPAPVTETVADDAWRTLDEFSTELARHLGPADRVRAWLSIAPLRRARPRQAELVGAPSGPDAGTSSSRNPATND
jgi:transglutaminase-like putative cysteine protease